MYKCNPNCFDKNKGAWAFLFYCTQQLYKRFINWFNRRCGWFFTNGRKQYNIDNLPDRK